MTVLLGVPCSEADAVALFDADTGREAGRVSVGAHPVHLATAGGRVLVATMGERSIDVVTDGAVERVPTGVLGPSHFAVDGDTAFVPCTGGDAVAVVDVDALELRERVPVGAEPHDAERVGDAVYVGSRADGTVTVLDAATATVRETVDVGPETGARARVQGLAAADGGVYAVDQANDRVVRLGGDGVTAAAVGANPYEPVVLDDRLFVAGRDDGTVTELTPDLSTSETYAVGGRPVDLVGAAGETWIVDRERPVVRSLSGASVDLPAPGFAAVADPERSAVAYVSHYDDDAVSAVDLGERAVRWTAATPARPFEPLVV